MESTMIPPKGQLVHRQGNAVFVALLLFNLTLILLQIWLFTATLENFIAGKTAMAVPAAIVSVLCAAANVWMLVGLYRVDRS